MSNVQTKNGWVLEIHNNKVDPRLWVAEDGVYARVYQSKYYKGWADSRGKASKQIGGLVPGKPREDGSVSNGYWTLYPPKKQEVA